MGPGTMISTSLLFKFVVLIYSFNMSHGVLWEIKNASGESWARDQRILAMSLEDHNDAFASSAAYCLGDDGLLNGFTRGMCTERCDNCRWKLREGFTTENEWRYAVMEEMTRLNGNHQGKIGTWIVQAPPPRDVTLDMEFITKIEASLNLSLRRFVKSEKRDDGRYFVVSGKLEEVCLPLLAIGFQACTPRPARLRIHPALLLDLIPGGGSDGSPAPSTTAMNIQVSLAPPVLQNANSDDNSKMRANVLAAKWSSVVATSVGHMNAIVRAASIDRVTIQRLTMMEVGEAALSIASSQLGEEVDFIYPVYQARNMNKYAASVVQGDSSARPILFINPPSYPLWEMGIHGEGQVIGVADSGLDWNHCFFKDSNAGNDPEFVNDPYLWESTTHRKIRQYATSWDSGDTRTAEKDDHGTHVCGTLAGTPERGSVAHRGIAYGAKLAFFDIQVRGEPEVVHIPDDMYRDLFPIPYSVGARIHSNSWGSAPEPGRSSDYNRRSRDADRFTYENQDFVIIISAGNHGPAEKIQPPATAKNVITVGASENTSALKSQLRKYHLLSFSSRGPTPDGRIKPDVCAPGVVKSARSISGWGIRKCGLATVTGTSMSVPSVSGVIALVRQYFMDGYYPDGEKRDADAFIPMGALLKAVVINSAQRMIGLEATQQAGGGEQIPNMNQGFGLVTVDSTLVTLETPSTRRLYVDGKWTHNCGACPRVNQFDVLDYRVKISRGSLMLPLKVTLAWSDYPGAPYSRSVLVNDLDLTVKGPNGAITYSNGGAGMDTKNPVEHIMIPAPREGFTYTVTVRGRSVHFGPQPYAIVISGPFEGAVTKRIRP